MRQTTKSIPKQRLTMRRHYSCQWPLAWPCTSLAVTSNPQLRAHRLFEALPQGVSRVLHEHFSWVLRSQTPNTSFIFWKKEYSTAWEIYANVWGNLGLIGPGSVNDSLYFLTKTTTRCTSLLVLVIALHVFGDLGSALNHMSI